jgi:hypothetical protein
MWQPITVESAPKRTKTGKLARVYAKAGQDVGYTQYPSYERMYHRRVEIKRNSALGTDNVNNEIFSTSCPAIDPTNDWIYIHDQQAGTLAVFDQDGVWQYDLQLQWKRYRNIPSNQFLARLIDDGRFTSVSALTITHERRLIVTTLDELKGWRMGRARLWVFDLNEQSEMVQLGGSRSVELRDPLGAVELDPVQPDNTDIPLRNSRFHPRCIVSDKYGNILLLDCEQGKIVYLDRHLSGLTHSPGRRILQLALHESANQPTLLYGLMTWEGRLRSFTVEYIGTRIKRLRHYKTFAFGREKIIKNGLGLHVTSVSVDPTSGYVFLVDSEQRVVMFDFQLMPEWKYRDTSDFGIIPEHNYQGTGGTGDDGKNCRDRKDRRDNEACRDCKEIRKAKEMRAAEIQLELVQAHERLRGRSTIRIIVQDMKPSHVVWQRDRFVVVSTRRNLFHFFSKQ